MTSATTRGGTEEGQRAGAQALALLSVPLNVRILHALARKPRSLADLRREAGFPPATTMRGYLRALSELGVLARHRQNDFPGNLDIELTTVGRDLIMVTRTLEQWLDAAPNGPLATGSPAAASAVKVLVQAWETSMMRALAARPLSLTELDSLINGVSYPSLERRLTSMRLAGQVKKVRGPGRGTPYAVTEWLRRAVAPLAAAARWERWHLPDQTSPIIRRDVEATFLLAVPLLRLAPSVSGSCQLVAEWNGSNGQGLAGVMVQVEEGRIASCVSRLSGHSDAWASGSPSTWLAALIEHDVRRLEISGDCDVAGALVGGLHTALFRSGILASS